MICRFLRLIFLWRANYFVFAPMTGDADSCMISDDTNRQWMGTQRRTSTMNQGTFRVVTRGADGQIRIRDYDTADALLKRHSQVGVDDCSTDLNLRGLPVFRGLIGPIPEGKDVIRYESPEVFETLTKEWGALRPSRRRSRSKTID
jgi:hypothetical protein